MQKRGRRYTIISGPVTQEAQDRDRRRRNDDWSEADAQYHGAGEMLTIFDIKDSSKGQVYVLCRATRSGFRQRLSANW